MPVKKDKKITGKKGTRITKKTTKAKAISKSSSTVYIDMRKTTLPKPRDTTKKPIIYPPQVLIQSVPQNPIYPPYAPISYAPSLRETAFSPAAKKEESSTLDIIAKTGYKIGHSMPTPPSSTTVETISREPMEETGVSISTPWSPVIGDQPSVKPSKIIPINKITKPSVPQPMFPVHRHRLGLVPRPALGTRPPVSLGGEDIPVRIGRSIQEPVSATGSGLSRDQPLEEHAAQLIPIPTYSAEANYGLTSEELDMYATYNGVTTNVARNLLRRRLSERKGSPLNAPPASQRNFSLEILKRAEKKYIKHEYPERETSPRPGKKI